MTADPLGPFQDIWKAWDEARDEICGKGVGHFERAVMIQFEELKEHLAEGKREKAAREAIDVISIALNLLRNMEYEPEEIATLAKARAHDRMQGKAREILQKYSNLYDI
jgi:hypothetical protein